MYEQVRPTYLLTYLLTINKVGRSESGLTSDVVVWSKASLQELSYTVHKIEPNGTRQYKEALDSNRCWIRDNDASVNYRTFVVLFFSVS